MRILAAPDKFRGTASAEEVAQAIAAAAQRVSASCDIALPADGGEGTLEALGGGNRRSIVTGPDGSPVSAPWRLVRGVAVIEMALASGLAVAGGAANNDPINATSKGTGELIAEAIRDGAHRVIVGVGGSATTDGGFDALRALPSDAQMRGVDLIVACDVRTRFLEAAAVFAPQKGASVAQVEFLRRRLVRLAQIYLNEYDIDVTSLPGAGAAGGLAGGLAARGARLVNGFDLVASELCLRDRIAEASLVVTGEGRLDATSFEGKVVGGIVGLAATAGVPVLAVVGSVDASAPDSVAGLDVIDLSARFGAVGASFDVGIRVRQVVLEFLRRA